MEEKTIGIIILGLVALIAVIGLVMMFKETSKTGAPITVGQVATTCSAGYFRTSPSTALELQQSGSAECKKMGPLYCCKNR